MKILGYALILFLLLSQPAAADPVSAVLASLGAAFKAAFTVKALTTFALKAAISTGVSLLTKRKQRKQRQQGLQTTVTTSGGTDPQGTVLGRYATAGHLVYRNSREANGTSLVHVIELGDLPGASLRRLVIDGEYSGIGATYYPDVGYRILTKSSSDGNFGFIKFYDGSQTAADPQLVAGFGADPSRPWTNDHILTGLNYAILTMVRNDKLFRNGVPQVRFELDGPKLYDPRQDSTAGGSGTQRWADPATWQPTVNLMVIAYHVLRGILLPCGSVWGGGFPEEDLPYTEWAAAMDKCDLGIGTENRPQFQGGLEIRFEEAPADFLEDVFASANAEILELGGYWYPLVGDADAFAADLTEEDLLVTEAWNHEPFPGQESTFNAVTITHPSPDALWNAAAPITITNDDWEAEDGGQRMFDLNLPMVYEGSQARQLGNALLNENRRFRTQRLPLPPEYARLRPLQNIRLTSGWYGFDTKAFAITEMAYDLLTLNVSVSLRERENSDFDPDPSLELPDPPQVTDPVVIADAGVPGFGVTGVEIKDAAGDVRGVGIRAVWSASLASSASGVSFQWRIKDGPDERSSASAGDLEQGTFLLEPAQGNTEYEVRAKAIARNRDTDWTGWLPVTTPVFQIRRDMLDAEITAEIEAAQAAADAAAAEAVTALAGASDAQGKIASIVAMDGSALPGTAFENLVTQLQVGVDGVSATITDHAAAVAEVDGFSAAYAGVTVETSGGKVAGFKATSWADPDGSSGGVLELLGDVIAEGTLATNRLTIGLGKNLLDNPDLAQGATAIAQSSSGAVGSGATMSLRGDGLYSDAFNRTIWLRTFAAATLDGWNGAEFRPPEENSGTLAPGYLAVEDKFYEFSAQLAVRQVRVAIRLYWLDGSGNAISSIDLVDKNWGTTFEGTASAIGAWVRYGGIAQAPANTRYVRPEIRIIGTDASSGSRDVHILRPMLAEAESLTARLSPYSPGGTSLIEGNRLVTGSITAQSGVIDELAVGRLNLAVGSVTEIVRLSKTASTSVAYNVGTRTGAEWSVHEEYSASGTAFMHGVAGAELTYTVPSSNPPEKLMIWANVRMGVSFWDFGGVTRAYRMTAAVVPRINGTDIYDRVLPSSDYSFYRLSNSSFPLPVEAPAALLELGTHYAAGDVITFYVYVYRGDLTGGFQFGFDIKEHTLDIMEIYK